MRLRVTPGRLRMMRRATAVMARARLSLAIAKADAMARRILGLIAESDAEVAQARRRGRGMLQVVQFQVVQFQVVANIQVVFQMVRCQVVANAVGLWWTLPAWGSAVYK